MINHRPTVGLARVNIATPSSQITREIAAVDGLEIGERTRETDLGE